MNLFEFGGPIESLTFCYLCSGMTIESIKKEGEKLVANGKVAIIDGMNNRLVFNYSWTAELSKNSDWVVCKSNIEDGNAEFIEIEKANNNLKLFIQKQLKGYCTQNKQFEHDFADDLTTDLVRTVSWWCPNYLRNFLTTKRRNRK